MQVKRLCIHTYWLSWVIIIYLSYLIYTGCNSHSKEGPGSSEEKVQTWYYMTKWHWNCWNFYTMRHLHSLKWWQKQQLIKWISSKQIQWPPYWNNEVFYYCACLKTVICHVKGELWKSKRPSNGRKISQIVGCSTSICPKTSNLKSRTVNQDLKTSPNIFFNQDSNVMRSCQRSLTWSEVTSSFMWLPIHLRSKSFLWSSVHIWTEGKQTMTEQTISTFDR